MDFDTYWEQLVERVYKGHEVLFGKEELFYRLSCIYGETMVDGIEAYFDRRFDEFEADMEALQGTGLHGVATEFQRARKVIFGDVALDQPTVQVMVRKLLDGKDDVQPILAKIDSIYRQLIPQLELLADYKYEFGLRQGLYSESA
jgi:hypothetical protein